MNNPTIEKEIDMGKTVSRALARFRTERMEIALTNRGLYPSEKVKGLII
ncbi:hypothetical protein [Cupriavidus sp. PET2-C1]